MNLPLRRPWSVSADFQSGFTLIEIMVGMTVGAIALLAVLNIFEASEGYKRTITSGGDAQTNGALAISALQRDIRQSGHGLNSLGLLGCTLALPGGITLAELAPVTINSASVPAGDANTDTLLVVYGSTLHSTEGNRITLVSGTAYTISPPAYYTIGDRVLAASSGTTDCNNTVTLGQVTGVSGETITVNTNLGAVAGASLFNLGPHPRLRAYAVRDSILTVCDFFENNCSVTGSTGNLAIWRPIAGNIVTLRAQYGRDTSIDMDGIVDTYDQTSATTSCDWARIVVARLAIVARSSQYEKNEIPTDGSSSTWAGQAGVPINLTGLPDSTHYRYKKYEANIPLINIIRAGVPGEC